MPDIPTSDETGVPGSICRDGSASGRPRARRRRSRQAQRAMVEALADPTVKARFTELGLDVAARAQQTRKAWPRSRRPRSKMVADHQRGRYRARKRIENATKGPSWRLIRRRSGFFVRGRHRRAALVVFVGHALGHERLALGASSFWSSAPNLHVSIFCALVSADAGVAISRRGSRAMMAMVRSMGMAPSGHSRLKSR